MSAGAFERRELLGFPIDAVTLPAAVGWVLERAGEVEPRLVVTLNPEILVRAAADERLAVALRGADLSVADGVGVTWAARALGRALPGRVPGVDLAIETLRRGGGGLRVYLLGGRPGVAALAAERVAERFGTDVVGARDGYFAPSEAAAVARVVAGSGAQLLLAGLGERQELFLAEHRRSLGVPVMIGVGGTLDVLAGTVRRMPRATSALGVEWLFRVGLDPKRWRRFPRLLRFVVWVMRARRAS